MKTTHFIVTTIFASSSWSFSSAHYLRGGNRQYNILKVHVLRDVNRNYSIPTKKLGVVLPTQKEIDHLVEMAKTDLITPWNDDYIEFGTNDTQYAIELHLMKANNYTLAQPLQFDTVDIFTDESIDYAQNVGLHGVISLSCFTSLVAAAIKDRVSEQRAEDNQMAGPTFDSVAIGTNKYYMRKLISPVTDGLANYDNVHKLLGKDGEHLFPVVLKFADTQYYSATYMLPTQEALRKFLDSESSPENKYAKFVLETAPGCDLEGTEECASLWRKMVKEDPQMAIFEKRQAYYFKHLSARAKKRFGITRPHDIKLVNLESWLTDFEEYQVEVVVGDEKQYLIHDTGDIIHSPRETSAITVFKTPFSLGGSEGLKTFLRAVVDSFVDEGWENGAMDIEFYIKSDGDSVHYYLGEVNTRYSFMAVKQEGITDERHGLLQVQSINPDFVTTYNGPTKPMRNYDNRVAMALGMIPPALPTEECHGIAMIAAFTTVDEKLFDGRQVGDVVDGDLLDRETNMYERFMPNATVIDEQSGAQYNGWTRTGCLFDVIFDDKDFINTRMRSLYHKAFAPGLSLNSEDDSSSELPYLLPLLTKQSEQLDRDFLQEPQVTTLTAI
ncbi:hypothetical protein ACHAWF_013485 [Thalassiosira exigua]